jgi:hypothetical protein
MEKCMVLKGLRIIGAGIIYPFAILFSLYILLFPLIGTFAALYLIRELWEKHGMSIDDLAFIPIGLTTILFQFACSCGAMYLLFMKH